MLKKTFVALLCSILNIVCWGQITADFSADQLKGCGQLQVQFTDISSSTDSQITAWQWDLGSVDSDLQNPGRIFANPGIYTICLTVWDAVGNQATSCKEEFIHVYPLPQALFSVAPASGCVPLEVSFADHSTSENGEIIEWIWGVGGTKGVVSTTDPMTLISTVYTQPDDYQVSLTILDEKGCSNTLTVPNAVQAGGIRNIVLASPDSISCDLPHQPEIQIVNPDPNVLYQWDFGNGMKGTGTSQTPLYTETGNFDIQIIGIHELTGCMDTFLFEDFITVGLDLDFSFSNTEICAKQAINFQDMSSIKGGEITWDFGDGETSQEENPRHQYSIPGCFTVTLTKTIDGCTSTKVSDVCILVKPKPEGELTWDHKVSCLTPANFELTVESASPMVYRFGLFSDSVLLLNSMNPNFSYHFDEQGEYPVYVRMINEAGCQSFLYDTLLAKPFQIEQSENGPGGCVPFEADVSNSFSSQFNIVDFEWNLYTNPIQQSTQPSPKFNISDPGRFDLTVIAQNDEGCRDTLDLEDYVSGGEGVNIDFQAEPREGCVDSTVQFTNLTEPSFGEYTWLFGDGSFLEMFSANHEYLDTGLFTVTLIADDRGCISMDSITDYIHIQPPVASFTYNIDCINHTVTFENLSIGADESFWDFGLESDNSDTTSIISPTFQYPQNGAYTVALTVFNAETGCTDMRLQTIDFSGVDVSFQIENNIGCAPFQINLSGIGNDIANWEWKALGGKIEDDTLQSTIVNYKFTGKYAPIELVGVSESGCRDTFKLTDSILVDQVFADYEIPIDLNCQNDSMTIFDQSVSLYSEIDSWNWIIGDSLILSQDKNVRFSLDSVGKYGIHLIVTNETGCFDEIEDLQRISVFDPDPLFRMDTLACPGLPIQFENLSTKGPGIIYFWDFGDGSTSNQIEPVYQYTMDGDYQVCLTLSNGNGCDSTLCSEDLIKIRTPKADFIADTSYANCPPLLVHYQNNSINASEFFWDFGDGSGASDLVTPPHVYSDPGLFDVKLIVKLTEACQDTLTRDEYIRLEGPQGSFEMEIDSICSPVHIRLKGSAVDEYRFIWDFGDGQIDSSATRTFFDTTDYTYTNVGNYVPKLILIDNEECLRSFSADDTVKVVASVQASLSGPGRICIGEELKLDATLSAELDGMLFEWSSNQELSCYDCLGIASQPDSSAWYYFETIHPNGCHFMDSIFVEVIDLPTVEIEKSKDTTICKGESIQLIAHSNIQFPSFLWKGESTVLSCDFCDTIEISLIKSESFTVTISDEFGCQNEETVHLDVFTENTSFVPDNETICLGDTLNLVVTDVTDIEWSSGETISCDTCLAVQIFPGESTSYSLTALNSLGCKLTDTIIVTVRSPEDISAGGDYYICRGESVLLEGLGFGNVNWIPGTFLDDPDNATAMSSPDSSITYIFRSQEGQCVLEDTLFISVRQKAEINLTGDTICFGEEAQLFASGEIDEFRWLDDEIEVTTSDSISIGNLSPLENRQVEVIGFLSSCEPDTAVAMIYVKDEIIFQLEDRVLEYPNRPYQLQLAIENPEDFNFKWSPEELFDCADCQEPTVEIDSAILIKLLVTNKETGCAKSDSIVFRVLSTCRPSKYIFIPNAFSPNGDGNNDEFGLYSDVHQEIYLFKLYDRWGNMVWSTEQITDRWDGRFQGILVPTGVYTYILRGPCDIDGSDFVVSGDVTVLR